MIGTLAALGGRLADLGIAVAVAVVTAIVTVRLSLRQFYSERWWEKKAEAYSALIEALTNKAFFLDRYYRGAIGDRDLSEEEAQILRERDQKAREAIEQFAYTGVFLISEPVAKELRRLVRELALHKHAHGDWLRDVERHSVAADNALKKITALARADLGVEPGHQRWWRIRWALPRPHSSPKGGTDSTRS